MASRASIAARAQVARERIKASILALAEGREDVPLPGPLGFSVKQPDLRAVYELEQVADSLDVLSGIPVTQGEPEAEPSGDTPDGVNAPEDEAEEPQDEREGETGDDLDTLTVVELKDRAKAAHVKGYGSMTKAELLDVLRQPK